MSETVSKAHHEAVVRGLSATIVAQGVEIERLKAMISPDTCYQCGVKEQAGIGILRGLCDDCGLENE